MFYKYIKQKIPTMKRYINLFEEFETSTKFSSKKSLVLVNTIVNEYNKQQCSITYNCNGISTQIKDCVPNLILNKNNEFYISFNDRDVFVDISINMLLVKSINTSNTNDFQKIFNFILNSGVSLTLDFKE